MLEVFRRSQRRWREAAFGMGAQYHLWTADELETLIKRRYPEHWAMYCDVRYPVMRCDIGRLAILHSYCGLYADLDILPNREGYAQTRLALTRVDLGPHRDRHTPQRLSQEEDHAKQN